jgi:hypothetical protein
MRLADILNERAKAKAQIHEGGNAFDGVGTIHIDELKPTLDYIAKKTNLRDIGGRVLGSVGKKEYSGDIDLAVEPKTKEEMEQFIADLRKTFGDTNVRKIGKLLTTKVPIQNFNPDNDGRYPRTGYVQVDYMFGDRDWLKLYLHSPRETESKLKGTHRNIALSTIAGYTDRATSKEVDDQGRPIETIRWKWSPNDGLIKVRRTSRKNDKTGKWLQKQDEEILGKPYKNANDIVKVLFNGKVGADVLNSAESIVEAVKKAFDKATQEEIFKQMAKNFSQHHDIGKKPFDYPPEIAQYMGSV